MVNRFRDYEFELYDFKSNQHLSSGCTSTREGVEPYSIGEEFIVGDFALFKNNSKRTRVCIVRKIERVGQTNKYNIYVEPTKKDVRAKDISHLLENDSDDEDNWWKKD